MGYAEDHYNAVYKMFSALGPNERDTYERQHP